MIQVYAMNPDGLPIPFGPPVEDLVRARTVVKTMDWLAKNWFAAGNTMKFYSEDIEVRATELDGSRNHSWDYMDQDPSGASDGVWFPRD